MTLPVNPGNEPFIPLPPHRREPEPDDPTDPWPDDEEDTEDEGLEDNRREWLGFGIWK
ncbi:hypothetical protein OE766_05710 [Pararhizobium sp. YC-54]|uniref:hypothetical protein n=1 Tax=Pararhizobium sp. YC-54 TaxID=2986920 RepID=UPI0021F6EABA|nr:hypothetical protein [Pararhizobium sp. YC-54]MCV9997736.1 hypothetical protein [Pararhizobium sp. YC-54]